MKISYSHLKRFIKSESNIDEVSEYLFQLGHEHEIIDNDVFDIEFTPNRGDCLSLRGLTRDLKPFYEIQLNKEIFDKEINDLNINFINKSQTDCSKITFLAIEVEDVVNSYKDYIEDYFNRFSINKNNFFTDVSNYLAYETGQPTHCYDFSAIKNETIVFTKENLKTEMITLLGNKINISGENCLFKLDKKVINLAGVIGDKTTACKKDTKKILLECASFKPESIIGRSIKYDLNSEAAYKFERGVDPNNQEYSIRRFIKIIEDHAKIKSLEIKTFSYDEAPARKISCNFKKLNTKLNLNLTDKEFKSIFESLGFEIDDEIIVPSHRFDIFNENDLAEEVARIIGYNNIKSEPLNIRNNNNNNVKNKNIDHIRSVLVKNGFNEVINYPFTDLEDNSIVVDNPLDSNKNALRKSLKNSLIENLLYNEKRQKDSIKIFEFSDIYTKSNNELEINKTLGIIISGRVGHNYIDFSQKLDLSFMENIIKKFGFKCDYSIEEIQRDQLDTKIKNAIFYAEIKINKNLPNLNYDNNFEYKNIMKVGTKYIQTSDYPSSKRDLSVLIKDENQIKEIEKSVLNFRSDYLQDSFVFDFFYNEKNSEYKIGFRFIFQSNSKTLEDKDVDTEINKIVNIIYSNNNVEIPGMKDDNY